MRDEKKEKKFIEFYRWLYGDTSKATWTWELPRISISEAENHKKMWKDEITKLLWPRRAKAVYKIRPYGPQTYLDYVFSWLWLDFWPTVIDDTTPEHWG